MNASMHRNLGALCALVAALAAAPSAPCVAAEPPPSAAAPAPKPASGQARALGVEASLPFANYRGNIYNWQADGEKGIWVQGIDRQWYYARFMSDCIGLPWANGLEFRSEPNGELDKFSSIIVRHEFSGPCQFTSFVTSAGPPSAKERKAAAAAAAAAKQTASGAASGSYPSPR